MKKRGALPLEMVAAAAIILFVIIVVIFIFGSHIKEYAKGFFEIGKESREQAEGKRCGSGLLGSRACYKGPKCPPDTRSHYYELVPEPVDKWLDCKDNKICCEKLPLEKTKEENE